MTVVIATILLIIAFFLHEDEERRLQDLVTETWVRVDSSSKIALTWQAKFARAAASRVDGLLRRLFGDSIWSAQAIGTSASLSFASLLALSESGPWHLPGGSFLEMLALNAAWSPVTILLTNEARSLWFVALVGGVLLGAMNVRLRALPIVVAVTFVAHGTGALNSNIRNLLFRSDIRFTVAAVVGGLACDIAVVAALRHACRAAETVPAWQTAISLIGVLSLAVLLTFGFAWLLGPDIVMDFRSHADSFFDGGQHFVGVVAATNLFGLIIALTAFAVALLLLIHGAAWPIISRSVYVIERFRILRNKKALIITASTLLTASTGIGQTFLTTVAKLLGAVMKLL